MGLTGGNNQNQPLTLAFDTSGRVGSAAIGFGDKIAVNMPFTSQLKHSSELFTVINRLLQDVDQKPMSIERLFFTIGPGSFTGLRIGVTLAKMAHLANKKINIIGLNTLDCLALNTENYQFPRIAPLLDAKRGLFFTAVYNFSNGKLHKIIKDNILNASEFIATVGNEPITVLGEGLVYYAEKFKKNNISIADEKLWTVKAEKVYKLGTEKAEKGEFSDPLALAPAYMRKPDAKIKKTLR